MGWFVFVIISIIFPAKEYYLLHHGLGSAAESESKSADYELFLAADFGESPSSEIQVFSSSETVESQGVFLNEKLHWINDDYNQPELIKPNFAFDVRTDEFSSSLTLPFPKVKFADMGSFSVALFTCEGCLCLWRYGLFAASVDFWVMTEYGNCDSWIFRHNFSISNQPERIQFLRPLLVTHTAKVLVRCSYDKKLELVGINDQDQAEEIVTYTHGWEDASARGCRMII